MKQTCIGTYLQTFFKSLDLNIKIANCAYLEDEIVPANNERSIKIAKEIGYIDMPFFKDANELEFVMMNNTSLGYGDFTIFTRNREELLGVVIAEATSQLISICELLGMFNGVPIRQITPLEDGFYTVIEFDY
jgi:hypothetical protein